MADRLRTKDKAPRPISPKKKKELDAGLSVMRGNPDAAKQPRTKKVLDPDLLAASAGKAEKTLVKLGVQPSVAGMDDMTQKDVEAFKVIKKAKTIKNAQPTASAMRNDARNNEELLVTKGPDGVLRPTMGPELTTESMVQDFKLREAATGAIKNLMRGDSPSGGIDEEDRQHFKLQVSPLTRPGDTVRRPIPAGLGGYSGSAPKPSRMAGFAGGVWAGNPPTTTGRGTPLSERGNPGVSRGTSTVRSSVFVERPDLESMVPEERRPMARLTEMESLLSPQEWSAMSSMGGVMGMSGVTPKGAKGIKATREVAQKAKAESESKAAKEQALKDMKEANTQKYANQPKKKKKK